MSDAPPPSSKGPILVFFICIIFIAVVTQGGQMSLLQNQGSTRPSASSTPIITAPDRDTTVSSPSDSGLNPGGEAVIESPALTPEETERRVANIYTKIDSLKRELREAELWNPPSPYRTSVSLSYGNTYTENPQEEYLTLTVRSSSTTTIPLSTWYVRSYVTGKSARMPYGDALLSDPDDPDNLPIALNPGETAYLVSGKSYVNTSFKEHRCSGYLMEDRPIFPTLGYNCPAPRAEMEANGTIKLDDDECYDFVGSLYSCRTPARDTYSRSSIGNACYTFVRNTLNYEDCVRLHRYEPYFYRPNIWRIYLDRSRDLWRSEREIIQLMDEQGRVVSVLEY